MRRPDREFTELLRKLKTRIDRLEDAQDKSGLALADYQLAPIISVQDRMLGDVSITATLSGITFTGVIDDFEDADLVEWDLAFTSDSYTDGISTNSYEGTYSFRQDGGANDGEGARFSMPGDGLPRYPLTGSTFKYRIQYNDTFGAGSTNFNMKKTTFFYFGVQSYTSGSNNLVDGYQILTVHDKDNPNLFGVNKRYIDGSFDVLQHDTGFAWPPSDEWPVVTIDWGFDGSINVTLEDEAQSTVLASVSVTDTEYTDGGIGVAIDRAGVDDGKMDCYWDIIHMPNIPIIWRTATDWDNAVSTTGPIVNGAVPNTDHGDASILQLGYDYSNPIASASILGYYPLDEDSGTTVNDIVNGNDATSSSVTVNGTGILGTTGYDFTGSGSIESFPFTLGAQTAYSVSMWINPDDTTSTQYLFKETNSGGGPGDVAAGYIDTGDVVFEQRNGGTTTISSPVTANAWSYWNFVWDGSNILLYEDSVQVASGGQSGINNATNALAVGYNNDTSSSFYNGQMDELRFDNAVLSATDINSMYQVANTPVSGSLTTASKTYSNTHQPDLYDLDYALNGESITIDVIGSPGTASEETVSQVLDGASSYTLPWTNSHSEFRVKPQLSTSTITASPDVNRIGIQA